MIIELLAMLKKELDVCIVLVTHDVSIAKSADRYVTLNYGKIINERRFRDLLRVKRIKRIKKNYYI